ncbi:MAG: cytochrome P450 [Paracoccaceae bacterium]
MKTAFDVIVRVTFSGGDGESTVPMDTVSEAIEHYLAKTARVSLLDFLGVPAWVPRPGRVRTHPTLKALKDGADAAIAERRRNPNADAPALLDLLLDAEDKKTGRRMTDAELRDNLITFLIAGHETTALTLSWALYLLALDPSTQKRAAQEAQAVLGARAATAEDVEKLTYVKQVLYETMRLYPPIPVHLRTAAADDEVCGHAVKKGDVMIVPFYALHRNRRLWDQPRKFVPERFDDMTTIDRFAYVPFSVGPRVCIGADFAMQEATIILATLLARHRFKLTDEPAPKPKLILTLRPDRDIRLEVSPRKPSKAASGESVAAAGKAKRRKTRKKAGKRGGKDA